MKPAQFEAHVADGSTQPLTSQRWFRISALAWLADGSGFLMLATLQQQFIRQIWKLSYPGGEAHRLTNDLNDYVGLRLTADSGALALVKTETQTNIWIAPDNEASRALRQLVSTVWIDLDHASRRYGEAATDR